MDWITDFFTGQVLGPLIGVIATALIGWIAAIYSKITGLQLEAAHRIALQSALENGMRAAIQLILKGKLAKDGTVPVESKIPVMKAAKEYVRMSVPDALVAFDIDDKKLGELLEPKLPNSGDQQKPPAKSLTSG